MPYIDREARERMAVEGVPHSAGELNYAITLIVDRYIRSRGLSYTVLNEVIGALECAKCELYRRRAVPYEDSKRQQNGDVYGLTD